MEFKDTVAELSAELKKPAPDKKHIAELVNGMIASYNQVITALKSRPSENEDVDELRKEIVKSDKKYKKKVIDLNTIFEIAKELTGSLEIDPLIKSIMLTSMGHLLVESAALFVIDDSSGCYVLRSSKNFKEDVSEYVLTENDEFIKSAVNFGHPEPASSFTASGSMLKEMNCEIVTPIMSKSKLIGILFLGQKIGGMPFTEANVEFLTALGHFAAIAIENAKLYANLDNRIKELSTLYNVSQEINKLTDMDVIINLMLDTIVIAFKVKKCSVVLFDELKGVLHIEKNVNCDEEIAKKMLKIIIEKEGNPLKTGDSLLLPAQSGMAAGDILFSIPLVAGNRKVGLLNIYRFDDGVALTEDFQKIFSIVASQMAPPVLLSQFFSKRNAYHEHPFDYIFNSINDMITMTGATNTGFILARITFQGQKMLYSEMKKVITGLSSVLQETDILIHTTPAEIMIIFPASEKTEVETLIDSIISSVLNMKVTRIVASFPHDGESADVLLSKIYSSPVN